MSDLADLHRVSALLMLLLAVVLAVFSILSRNQQGLLRRALPLTWLAVPLFVIVAATGAARMGAIDESFLQAWIVGALLLGLAFVGLVHGLWRPKARAIAAQDGTAGSTLVGVALAMTAMIFGASYLMEIGVG